VGGGYPGRGPGLDGHPPPARPERLLQLLVRAAVALRSLSVFVRVARAVPSWETVRQALLFYLSAQPPALAPAVTRALRHRLPRSLRRRPRTLAVDWHLRPYYGSPRTAGVGGAIAGRRFDMGIIDDPIKDRLAANSPVMREAVWRWFTSTFHTRQAKDAGILLTLTRWHEDDLAGRLLAKAAAGEGEPWDVLSLPSVATGKNQHPDDPRKPGEALWPWFKPITELEQIERIEPRDFAALYQQDPMGEGGTEWPGEYFTWDGFWFDDWPAPENTVMRVMALDPSMADSDHAGDYQALVVLYLDRQARVYVDAFLVRLDATRLVEFAVKVWEAHQPTAFAVEANVFQKLLLKDFARVSRERMLRLPLYSINHKKVEKKLRLRTLGPYLARKELRFKRGSAGARLLVEQLKQFPVGQFDDGPDGLQMGIKMMKYMLGDRKARPEEGALPQLFAAA
jgi:hypothetical protein